MKTPSQTLTDKTINFIILQFETTGVNKLSGKNKL